ncbi:hypothetical protein ppKF707_2330 [Metapseudomonas furukawaii]|nr:hypothetical protein ppKF707_2330 [Pseudomonas furukawaii]
MGAGAVGAVAADGAVEQVQGTVAHDAQAATEAGAGVAADRGVDQRQGDTATVDAAAAEAALGAVGDAGITQGEAGAEADGQTGAAPRCRALGQVQARQLDAGETGVDLEDTAGVVGRQGHVGDAVVIEVAVDRQVAVIDQQLVAVEGDGAALVAEGTGIQVESDAVASTGPVQCLADAQAATIRLVGGEAGASGLVGTGVEAGGHHQGRVIHGHDDAVAVAVARPIGGLHRDGNGPRARRREDQPFQGGIHLGGAACDGDAAAAVVADAGGTAGGRRKGATGGRDHHGQAAAVTHRDGVAIAAAEHQRRDGGGGLRARHGVDRRFGIHLEVGGVAGAAAGIAGGVEVAGVVEGKDVVGIGHTRARGEGRGPGDAAIAGAEVAQRAVLHGEITRIQPGHRLAEDEGDGGGFADAQHRVVHIDTDQGRAQGIDLVVAGTGAAGARVAGDVGDTGVVEADEVGRALDTGAGGEGGRPDDVVLGGQVAQGAIGHGEVAQAQAGHGLAEGDGHRAGLAGGEGGVRHHYAGRGPQRVDGVAVGIGGAGTGIAGQVGVAAVVQRDQVARSLDAGRRGQGGGPGDAAVAGGQVAQGAVGQGEVTDGEAGHRLAEGDGDRRGFTRRQGGVVHLDADRGGCNGFDHGDRDIGAARGAAIAVVQGDTQGAIRLVDPVGGIAVAVVQVANQSLYRGRRGVRVEADHQVGARAAARPGADDGALVGDIAAGKADLPRSRSLVGYPQHILPGHAVGQDGDRDVATGEIGRVAIGDRGVGAEVQQDRAAALGEGDAVAIEIAHHRRGIDRRGQGDVVARAAQITGREDGAIAAGRDGAALGQAAEAAGYRIGDVVVDDAVAVPLPRRIAMARVQGCAAKAHGAIDHDLVMAGAGRGAIDLYRQGAAGGQGQAAIDGQGADAVVHTGDAGRQGAATLDADVAAQGAGARKGAAAGYQGRAGGAAVHHQGTGGDRGGAGVGLGAGQGQAAGAGLGQGAGTADHAGQGQRSGGLDRGAAGHREVVVEGGSGGRHQGAAAQDQVTAAEVGVAGHLDPAAGEGGGAAVAIASRQRQ